MPRKPATAKKALKLLKLVDEAADQFVGELTPDDLEEAEGEMIENVCRCFSPSLLSNGMSTETCGYSS